jgi:hypothetical protein
MSKIERFEDLEVWQHARDFKEGHNKSDIISKELSNFIKYLKNSEIKGLKYK